MTLPGSWGLLYRLNQGKCFPGWGSIVDCTSQESHCPDLAWEAQASNRLVTPCCVHGAVSVDAHLSLSHSFRAREGRQKEVGYPRCLVSAFLTVRTPGDLPQVTQATPVTWRATDRNGGPLGRQLVIPHKSSWDNKEIMYLYFFKCMNELYFNVKIKFILI